MPRESNWHKKIRNDIEQFLKDKDIKFESSHGTGKVPLFIDPTDTSRSGQLSDTDIIVIRDRVIKYIIEIETGAPTPKKIIGVIIATDLSTIYKRYEDEFKIEDAKLFVITQAEKTNMQGSKKPDQYKNIKSHLKDRVSIKFEIFTEEDLEKIFTEIAPK